MNTVLAHLRSRLTDGADTLTLLIAPIVGLGGIAAAIFGLTAIPKVLFAAEALALHEVWSLATCAFIAGWAVAGSEKERERLVGSYSVTGAHGNARTLLGLALFVSTLSFAMGFEPSATALVRALPHALLSIGLYSLFVALPWSSNSALERAKDVKVREFFDHYKVEGQSHKDGEWVQLAKFTDPRDLSAATEMMASQRSTGKWSSLRLVNEAGYINTLSAH